MSDSTNPESQSIIGSPAFALVAEEAARLIRQEPRWSAPKKERGAASSSPRLTKANAKKVALKAIKEADPKAFRDALALADRSDPWAFVAWMKGEAPKGKESPWSKLIEIIVSEGLPMGRAVGEWIHQEPASIDELSAKEAGKLRESRETLIREIVANEFAFNWNNFIPLMKALRGWCQSQPGDAKKGAIKPSDLRKFFLIAGEWEDVDGKERWIESIEPSWLPAAMSIGAQVDPKIDWALGASAMLIDPDLKENERRTMAGWSQAVAIMEREGKPIPKEAIEPLLALGLMHGQSELVGAMLRQFQSDAPLRHGWVALAHKQQVMLADWLGSREPMPLLWLAAGMMEERYEGSGEIDGAQWFRALARVPELLEQACAAPRPEAIAHLSPKALERIASIDERLLDEDSTGRTAFDWRVIMWIEGNKDEPNWKAWMTPRWSPRFMKADWTGEPLLKKIQSYEPSAAEEIEPLLATQEKKQLRESAAPAKRSSSKKRAPRARL